MKVWAYDDEIDDDDLNFLGSRVINRYTSKAERQAAIPTPEAGMCAWVTGTGLTVYDGSAWRRVVTEPEP